MCGFMHTLAKVGSAGALICGGVLLGCGYGFNLTVLIVVGWCLITVLVFGVMIGFFVGVVLHIRHALGPHGDDSLHAPATAPTP